MKSISELLKQLQPGSEADTPDSLAGVEPGAWALLERIRSEGGTVIVKLDGERQSDRRTVVISGGLLGEDFFRKDGEDLNELLREALNFYDQRIWSRAAQIG